MSAVKTFSPGIPHFAPIVMKPQWLARHSWPNCPIILQWGRCQRETYHPYFPSEVSTLFCVETFSNSVACAPSNALYYPTTAVQKNYEASQMGQVIFKEFTTVVTLKEQMCMQDPVWQDFLQHIRFRCVQEQHFTMLHTLIISEKECMPTDLANPPWNNVQLGTSWHAVQQLWNEAALCQTGVNGKYCIFQCQAEDTIKGWPLTVSKQYAVASRYSKGNKKQGRHNLPDTVYMVELAISMEVMVTLNVEMDLDIMNGTHSKVMEILLSAEEPLISEEWGVAKLHYLPVYILVKLDHTWATKLKHLEDCVVPAEPRWKSFQISCKSDEVKSLSHTVCQCQFPLTAAYAFTNYIPVTRTDYTYHFGQHYNTTNWRPQSVQFICCFILKLRLIHHKAFMQLWQQTFLHKAIALNYWQKMIGSVWWIIKHYWNGEQQAMTWGG
jgi:hypothetical protein